jgi:hypothetical protein
MLFGLVNNYEKGPIRISISWEVAIIVLTSLWKARVPFLAKIEERATACSPQN